MSQINKQSELKKKNLGSFKLTCLMYVTGLIVTFVTMICIRLEKQLC